MSPDNRSDPYTSHRFTVEVDDLVVGGFAEVRGLSTSVEVRDAGDATGWETWRDVVGQHTGNVGATLRERFGDTEVGESIASDVGAVIPSTNRRTTSPHLELRRGVTDSRALWDWLQGWVDGQVEPRDVRVFLLDGAGNEARGWVCRGATPTRWSGPDLVADRNAVAMESLELAHDGLELLNVSDDADDADDG